MQASVNNIRGVYRNAGFSQVSVTPDVKRPNGDVAVTFEIIEGPRDTVQSFVNRRKHTAGVTTRAKRAEHRPGKPYSPFLVNQDRNQIMLAVPLSRILDGHISLRAQRPTSRRSRDYEIMYQIHEGQQVKTAKVITIGRQQTKQHIVNTTVKMRPGVPHQRRSVTLGREPPLRPWHFRLGRSRPEEGSHYQDNEDVLIKLHEAKRNTINYGFGFEMINRGGSVPGGTVAVPGVPPVGVPSSFVTSEKTFWGPRGLVDYTRKNLRGTAESMTSAASLAASINVFMANTSFLLSAGAAGRQLQRFVRARQRKPDLH